MRVGIIDVGTNSTRMLLAEVLAGQVQPCRSDLVTTRLGQGIAGGLLTAEAMRRTVDAVRSFTSRLKTLGAEEVIIAATAAVREARNGQDFTSLVYRETGIRVTVLSGEEEAYYGYAGVTAGLTGVAGQAVIMDIGGGSTEFTWPEEGMLAHRSLPAGAVRMTEQIHADEEIRTILQDVCHTLRARPEIKLIGIGGTMTTLAAMDQALAVYDPERVHGYVLTLAKIKGLLAELQGRSITERRLMPGLQPERADIIVAGVRICCLAMETMGRDEVMVSEYDILHGLARHAGSGKSAGNY